MHRGVFERKVFRTEKKNIFYLKRLEKSCIFKTVDSKLCYSFQDFHKRYLAQFS